MFNLRYLQNQQKYNLVPKPMQKYSKKIKKVQKTFVQPSVIGEVQEEAHLKSDGQKKFSISLLCPQHLVFILYNLFCA